MHLKYIFTIVIFTFQIYFIYRSVRGLDKNNDIVDISTINSFFLLFLAHDNLMFLFILYIMILIDLISKF
ncbi:putative membrane protein [Streptococcus equi subsp. zooepidemicus]|uniref:Putative membrane protein n=1 Tax=Streptococcus equi subsp. zooepidemicus (strain H70) TaxID=553483 RepID=C0MH65_STRS7|nr:putative membrane protein [Streptococcus equi subsp. zooepidemicus]